MYFIYICKQSLDYSNKRCCYVIIKESKSHWFLWTQNVESIWKFIKHREYVLLFNVVYVAIAWAVVNDDMINSEWSSEHIECFLVWLIMVEKALFVWINNDTQINGWWCVIQLHNNYCTNSNINTSSIHTKTTLYFRKIHKSVLIKK